MPSGAGGAEGGVGVSLPRPFNPASGLAQTASASCGTMTARWPHALGLACGGEPVGGGLLRWQAERTGLPVQLPCEAEWYQLRDSLPVDQPDWEQAPGNINLGSGPPPAPVDHFAQGDFFDLLGNVWQWSRSTMRVWPTPRHPFSTPPSMANMPSSGGSWISTGNLAIRASRYAFRRHFFQHAGFRYGLLASGRLSAPTLPAGWASRVGAGRRPMGNACQGCNIRL